MSFSRIYSVQVNMLKGQIISVETDITKKTLNAFSIVGLPDKAALEARDRVSSALKNSGFKSPKNLNQKTIVALAPAEIKKEGSSFDLAIALGYLLSREEIDFEPEGKIFIGELALNGELQRVRGTLPIVEAARAKGFKEIYVPAQNAKEAALTRGIKIYSVRTLTELLNHLEEEALKPEPETILETKIVSEPAINFCDIRGQEGAKRGLEIAAAGGHNIAMSGPPGTGKTMLSKAFAALLPPLSLDEVLEITGIHSVAGTNAGELVLEPPFRSPHHSASYVSIIGGGAIIKPGEVTLAHRGILFLDEFPEFDRRVIESLRQPLEDKLVNISRAKGSARFPANFILIAAMNPCPCGYLDSAHKECVCRPSDTDRYKRKVSGPIIDRIDIWLSVENVDYEKLSDRNFQAEDSLQIQSRVLEARAKQALRFQGMKIKTNSEMGVKEIDQLEISDEVRKLLNESARRFDLSPRSYHRIIKLAQTIADLDNSDKIKEPHIMEALQYRPKINL